MTAPRSIAPGLSLVLSLAASVSAAAGPPDLPADVFAPTAAAPLRLPDEVFARPPGDDLLDVVLFGGSRAAVVRVRVTVAGSGYRSAWGAFVVRLHAYLDRNGDGTLSTVEANRAPWTQLLQNPFNGGGSVIRPGNRPVAIDSNPKDGRVTLEELSAYLRASQSFDELGSRAGAPPDARTEAVFARLDRDADKAIATSELADAAGLFARLDTDEDELVSLDELTPDRSPFADRFRGVNLGNGVLDPATSAAVALSGDDARDRVAARLLARFGKAGPKAGGKGPGVGASAIGAEPAAFRAADADGNGALDLAELKRYLLDPSPHFEADIDLPTIGPQSRAAATITMRAKPPGKAPPDALPFRAKGNGIYVIEFDGTEVELRALDNVNFPGNFFEDQFKTADLDKSGGLDAKEVRGNFFMQRMFPVADRDGDGKMTLAELNVYLQHAQDASASRTMLTVADGGLALYEKLDADHDNRLSLRELRGATGRLKGLDRDNDGRLALGELPRRSLLTLGRGDTRNNNFVTTAIASPANGPAGKATNTPAWFLGMDRNRDGDVSPREFLGTPEHFRLFDADRDGLIDAAEAAKSP